MSALIPPPPPPPKPQRLADELIRAIEANREAIDSSALAQGQPGVVEMHVNLKMCKIDPVIRPSARLMTYRTQAA